MLIIITWNKEELSVVINLMSGPHALLLHAAKSQSEALSWTRMNTYGTENIVCPRSDVLSEVADWHNSLASDTQMVTAKWLFFANRARLSKKNSLCHVYTNHSSYEPF